MVCQTIKSPNRLQVETELSSIAPAPVDTTSLRILRLDRYFLQR